METDVVVNKSRADELSIFRQNVVDENYKSLREGFKKLYESNEGQEVLDRMTQIEFNRLLYNYLSSALAWKTKYANLIGDFDELDMTKPNFYDKLENDIGEDRFNYFRYLRNYLTHTGQAKHIVSINSGQVEIEITMKREMKLEFEEKMTKFDRESENKKENLYDKAYTFQTSNKRDNIAEELEKFHEGIKEIDKFLLNKILDEM